jgi:hypothetical protein
VIFVTWYVDVCFLEEAASSVSRVKSSQPISRTPYVAERTETYVGTNARKGRLCQWESVVKKDLHICYRNRVKILKNFLDLFYFID